MPKTEENIKPKRCQIALDEESKAMLDLYAAYHRIQIKDALSIAVREMCSGMQVSTGNDKEER